MVSQMILGLRSVVMLIIGGLFDVLHQLLGPIISLGGEDG